MINGTASVGWVSHVETDINNLQVNTVINIYKDHPRETRRTARMAEMATRRKLIVSSSAS